MTQKNSVLRRMHTVMLRAFASAVVVMLLPAPGTHLRADDSWSEDWISTIEAAEEDDSKPILVKFEAAWCGPCKLLTEAMKDAEAIHLLSRMHLVKIDVDHPSEEAPVDDVAALPTMRVMNSAGEVIAEHVGYIEGEALMQFLRDGQEQYKAKRAALRLVKSLGNGGSLSDKQTEVLLEMLADRSPRQRAAASGLLIAHPQSVAASVITAFEKPRLRSRLAALDVLRRWTAPVDGLDPWQPETITKDRIAELKIWSQTFSEQSDLHSQMQQQALDEAELELDRLVRRGDARDGAVESLGMAGKELQPSVDKRLETETTDTARQRLASVLYRLVSAPTLAIRLPEATDSLASMDADERRTAAKQLADQARSEDLPLLETLFGHSDPLVRELALRGLQNAGGGDTTRLTRLLDDPDKNVRAAVLKLWLDNPKASLVKPVSQHALKETDSGLLVYYVRLLKELNSNLEQSHAALKRLSSDSDWQVRAAVAEAISHRITEAAKSAPSVGGVKKVAFPVDLKEAARRLLEDDDSFVLSKIVPAVVAGDQKESFSKLLEIAWKNPNIRAEILPRLTYSEGKRDAREFLVKRFESEVAADRIFALEAMTRFSTKDRKDFIRRGVLDGDPKVKVSAARALSSWLDANHSRLAPVPPTPPTENVYQLGFGYDSPFGVPTSSGSARPVPGRAAAPVIRSGGIGVKVGVSPPSNLEMGSAEFDAAIEDLFAAPAAVPAEADIETMLQVIEEGGVPAVEVLEEDNSPFQVVDATGLDQQGVAVTEDDPFVEATQQTVPVTPNVQAKPDGQDAVQQGGILQALGNLFGGDVPVQVDADPTEIVELMEDPFQGDAPSQAVQESGEPTNNRQLEATRKYDDWLARWRERPDDIESWLEGLRQPLEELAAKGGEAEFDVMMAVLRLGGTASAKEILDVASESASRKQITNVYKWLDPKTRRELLKLIGATPEAADLLPRILQESRKYDPTVSHQAFWNSLKQIDIDAFDHGWQLRTNLMMVASGSEYFMQQDGQSYDVVAESLSEDLKLLEPSAALMVGLSVLSEIDPAKVVDVVRDDYADASLSAPLRRDWARFAMSARKAPEASALAVKFLDDDVLRPVALSYITQGQEGVSSTEVGHLDVSGLQEDVYTSGRLTIARITPHVTREHLLPLLDSEEEEIVALATYALVVMGESVDLGPLLDQAQSEGFSRYLSGTTDLLVMAIAARNHDEDVSILEEIYPQLRDNYYIKEFYWKIRIMTGPKALALRKRIRNDVGMEQLT